MVIISYGRLEALSMLKGHVLRKLLMPALCEYADAYIAGHEHDLELLTDDCSKYGQASKT